MTKKRSPVETEIKHLKEEKRLKRSKIQLRINALKKRLSSPEKPVDVRTQSLEKELALLLTEKKKLLVYAPNGCHGGVDSMQGGGKKYRPLFRY